MVIRKLLLTIALFTLCIAPLTSTWANLIASVDKTTYTEDEQIQLNLMTDAFQLMSSPDLSVLENDFDVLGTQRSSTIRIINGQNQSTNKWLITLAPKDTGKITIPAIQMGSDSSQPIQITVTKAKASTGAAGNKDLFMEVVVDKNKVYVQAQLIYTIRLYYRPEVIDGNPTDPELNDAIVELLGDPKSYSKMVNGIRYRVFERNYAIFPQKSGKLEIPQQVFTGKVEQAVNRRGFFSSSTWKTIRIRSEAKTITVLPPPASYKESAWLPAAKITANAYWSEENPTFKVGEPVTRVFEIIAEGLSATQLPPIEEKNLPDFKIYPDNPATSIQENEKGLVGIRKETAAYVPTKAGKLKLPEHTISWWDTKANKVRHAVIPVETITVTSDLPTQIQQEPTVTAQQTKPTETTVTSGDTRLWQLLTGLFVITTLIFASLWLIKKPTTKDNHNQRKQPTHTSRENSAFNELLSAIKSNSAAESHSRLLIWLKVMNNNLDLQKLMALAKQQQKDHILLELDFVVYGKGGYAKSWNGSGLAELLKRLRKELLHNASKQQSGLPALYPT